MLELTVSGILFILFQKLPRSNFGSFILKHISKKISRVRNFIFFPLFCHSEIIEYVWHHRQNPKGRILRRFECILCGPLDFRTLLPLQKGNEDAETSIVPM